jgi:cytoskeletal protein RodZ
MKKLSDILREKRVEQGKTIATIAKEIKIRTEFLEAIEDGRYKDLPSDSHAAGFVKNYAEHLGFPESKTLALFRRDYKTGRIDVVPNYRKKKYTRTKSLFMSMKGGLFLAVGIVILVYLGFQFLSVFKGPTLTVQTPKNNSIINENMFEVSGTTDPYATLLINDEPTYVGLDGAFRKTLYGFEGKQVVRVVVKNKFGKETTEEITVTIQ